MCLCICPCLRHEDSAPAQVDELAQPQRAGEEREKFTGGQRREAEEGGGQCHLEQVRSDRCQAAENALFNMRLRALTQVLCVSRCSIHNAVIAVFQKKGLADNELYVLNEGVR